MHTEELEKQQNIAPKYIHKKAFRENLVTYYLFQTNVYIKGKLDGSVTLTLLFHR